MIPGICRNSNAIAINGNKKLQNNRLFLFCLDTMILTTIMYDANHKPSGSEYRVIWFKEILLTTSLNRSIYSFSPNDSTHLNINKVLGLNNRYILPPIPNKNSDRID